MANNRTRQNRIIDQEKTELVGSHSVQTKYQHHQADEIHRGSRREGGQGTGWTRLAQITNDELEKNRHHGESSSFKSG